MSKKRKLITQLHGQEEMTILPPKSHLCVLSIIAPATGFKKGRKFGTTASNSLGLFFLCPRSFTMPFFFTAVIISVCFHAVSLNPIWIIASIVGFFLLLLLNLPMKCCCIYSIFMLWDDVIPLSKQPIGNTLQLFHLLLAEKKVCFFVLSKLDQNNSLSGNSRVWYYDGAVCKKEEFTHSHTAKNVGTKWKAHTYAHTDKMTYRIRNDSN